MSSIKFLADKGMDFNRIFKFGIVLFMYFKELWINKWININKFFIKKK